MRSSCSASALAVNVELWLLMAEGPSDGDRPRDERKETFGLCPLFERRLAGEFGVDRFDSIPSAASTISGDALYLALPLGLVSLANIRPLLGFLISGAPVCASRSSGDGRGGNGGGAGGAADGDLLGEPEPPRESLSFGLRRLSLASGAVRLLLFAFGELAHWGSLPGTAFE